MKTVVNLLFYSLIPLGSLLTSCTTTSNPPVIVQITESTPTGGRFLSAERQRDVWMAPQALDGETLQHEQYVTFIEKPASWKVSSTMEPHSTPSPKLPLENGRYDAEALRREREIARTTQAKADQLSTELESLKSESSKGLQEKDEQIQKTEEALQVVRNRLEASEKRLASMEASEKSKVEQMTAKQKSKSWWNLW